MKCPQCSAEFRLTWPIYIKAPFGKFTCPSCGTALAAAHHWWYWPLITLGCYALPIPAGILVANHSGFAAGVVVAGIGVAAVGLPFDKFLESRFAILHVRRTDSTETR